MSPERYACNAMYAAIGALKALKRDGDNLDRIIRQLEISIEKIGGPDECRHGGAHAAKSPNGCYEGTCRKCGKVFTMPD